jgi:hypothetical protein
MNGKSNYFLKRRMKFYLIAFALTINFCKGQDAAKKNDFRFTNSLSTAENPGYWINLNTRKEDAEHPGEYFSSTDSKQPYGAGFEYPFPDDLKRKNILLSIHAKFRVTDSTQKVLLVTNLLHGDSSIVWKGLDVTGKSKKVNEWFVLTDSLLIPANLPADTKIKIYLWNQDGKAEADLDDPEIRLSVLPVHSYLVR